MKKNYLVISLIAVICLIGFAGTTYGLKLHAEKVKAENEAKILSAKVELEKTQAEIKAQEEKALAEKKAAEAKAAAEKAKADASARAAAEKARQKRIDDCLIEAYVSYSSDWDLTCYSIGEYANCYLPPNTARNLDERKANAEQNCINRY